ncbi:serine hydrolase domain-containing protein [Virgibacillus halophilus]|uniref:Serine hydrolase domain-containing protein n=2 Tax=Tigheibacillus halophilus TaxID=361280 RepID=A0ABU5C6D6_9BACI|nr:serine hydrolase domain-containing protein [Virgibacillus halophilus]
MLHLAQHSDFSINKPLKDHLSCFDSQELRSITTKHILSHETGFTGDFPLVSSLDSEMSLWYQDIPAYKENLEEMQRIIGTHAIQSREDIASSFSKLPLKHRPGSQTEYNIEPFLLAAIILEKLSGMTWEAYITTHIFQPLGLNKTRIHLDAAAANEASSHYINAIGQPIEAPVPYNPLGAPIASIFSTVNEMLVFLEHCLLQSKQATGAFIQDTPSVFMQGWHIEEEDGKQIWSLSGNQLGGSSYIEMVPAFSYGAVIFANIDMLRLPRLAKRIRNFLLP